jgi:lysozyme family protein
MAVYTKLIPIVLKWEGGYAGNIDGMTCTMKGVTLATYRKYFGKNKNCKDLKAITNAEWDLIFKEGFWDRWKADDIESQAIANLLVDWCWASGVYGIKLPQRVLGVKDDGIVGKKTIAAINDYPDKKELFQKLWNRRKKHFQDIAKNGKEKFLKGWLNRLNDFKYFE